MVEAGEQPSLQSQPGQNSEFQASKCYTVSENDKEKGERNKERRKRKEGKKKQRRKQIMK